ncbi:hypothetical protein J008_02245 [Cryptococcus neoformans]|nr:hypothetical protein J008_02245 [Cryptococcus neoformans var. grubii]
MFHLSPTPFVPSKLLLSSSPSRITIHRNQLRRASSLENITVGGLANWRRKPKPSTSQSQHSVESAGSKESSREAKNGSKRGLGMGMQATPARKRRLTNKSSIGTMSTPKTMRSRFRSREGHLTSSTCRSIPSNELLDSAEDATSPSISANDINPIGGNRDSIWMMDEGSSTPNILYSSGSHILFPAALDIVVPLNDIPSTSQRYPHMIPTSGDAFSKLEWDITVPLNDVLSTPQATRITSSWQAASRIDQRQSTPYRHGGSSSPVAISIDTTSGNDNGVLDESVEFVRSKCPSPEGLDHPVFDSDRHHENYIAASSDIQLFETPIRKRVMEDIFLDTQLEEFGGQKMASRALTPIPKNMAPLSNGFLRDKRRERAENLKSPVQHHEASWMDPFGFWWMCHIVSDKSPAVYDPSSPPRPETPRSSTPLMSPSMTSRTTSIESTDYLSHGSTEEEEETPIPGKWRGAEMMARMEGDFIATEGQGSHISEEHRHEAIDPQERPERQNRRHRRENKLVKLTEEFSCQREARIQHYKDLEEHYSLKMELVLG